MTPSEQAVANLAHALETQALQYAMLVNLQQWAEGQATDLADKGISVSLIHLMGAIGEAAVQAQNAGSTYRGKLEELSRQIQTSFSR